MLRIPAARALMVALVAAAQLAIVAVGPLVDRVPGPTEHRAHVSDGTDSACHPYHDDHCVVCRALSGDLLATASSQPEQPPTRVAAEGVTPTVASAPAPSRSRVHARGPPVA